MVFQFFIVFKPKDKAAGIDIEAQGTVVFKLHRGCRCSVGGRAWAGLSLTSLTCSSCDLSHASDVVPFCQGSECSEDQEPMPEEEVKCGARSPDVSKCSFAMSLCYMVFLFIWFIILNVLYFLALFGCCEEDVRQ